MEGKIKYIKGNIPVIKNKLSFLVNFRRQENKNHLNGIYRFDVDNYSDFSSDNEDVLYSEHTGTGSYLPMNNSEETTVAVKLSSSLTPDIRLSLMYNLNDAVWKDYDHIYKYNPKGLPHNDKNTHLLSFDINHVITNFFFYEVKLWPEPP